MSQRVTVVIPAARRANDASRPTWLQVRPDGALVIEAIVKELDFSNCGRVIIAINPNDAAELDLATSEAFIKRAATNLPEDATVTIHVLQQATRNATETVRCTLESLDVTGPFFVKDCDGAFKHTIRAGNYVVALKLTSENRKHVYDLPRMSFVEESDGILTNICEKHVMSDLVCTGGYSFNDAKAFVALQKDVIRAVPKNASVFVSHVVLFMLLQDFVFNVAKVHAFEDWKSPGAWRSKAATYRNLVVELEGVLATPCPNYAAAHMAGKPFSERYEAQPENVATLRAALEAHSRWSLVVMASEPESSREDVEGFLRKCDLLSRCTLVLGVPAVQTTLVNCHDGLRRMYPRADAHTVPAGGHTLSTVIGPLV